MREREAGLLAVLRQGSSAVQRRNEYSGEEGYQQIFFWWKIWVIGTQWIPGNSLGKYGIYFNNINNIY